MGYESTNKLTSGIAATQLAISSITGSLQSSLESEAAERKNQDEKISKSIGNINNTLLGYIGSSSTSNIGDGTLRGAIGNTSIAGIGAANNITSAINGLNSKVGGLSTDIQSVQKNIDAVGSNYAISKIDKVDNANYYLNGTNGLHYYYIKVGNLVFLNLNVRINNAIPLGYAQAGQKIGKNLPKPLTGITVTIPLGSQNINSASALGTITEDGDIEIYGGKSNDYVYGNIVYICE